jgi:hypothetical protein
LHPLVDPLDPEPDLPVPVPPGTPQPEQPAQAEQFMQPLQPVQPSQPSQPSQPVQPPQLSQLSHAAQVSHEAHPAWAPLLLLLLVFPVLLLVFPVLLLPVEPVEPVGFVVFEPVGFLPVVEPVLLAGLHFGRLPQLFWPTLQHFALEAVFFFFGAGAFFVASAAETFFPELKSDALPLTSSGVEDPAHPHIPEVPTKQTATVPKAIRSMPR